MKKIIKIGVFIFLCVFTVSLSACGNEGASTTEYTGSIDSLTDINVDELNYRTVDTSGVYDVNGDCIEITGLEDKHEAGFKIPSTIDGKSVISIAGHAFQLEDIYEIIIPASVTNIGDSAFSGCTTLKTIAFEGDGLTSIGEYAFAHTGLSEVVVPDSVTEIGQYAFSGNTKLVTVELGDDIIESAPYLFNNCTALKTVTLSSDFKVLGIGTFAGCSSLETFAMPSKVTVIRPYAFNNCTSLKTINLGTASITGIGSYAFAGCSSLEAFTFPATLTQISDYGFYGCTSLKNVVLPVSLTTFGAHIFAKCTSLESLKLTYGGGIQSVYTLFTKITGDNGDIYTFEIPTSLKTIEVVYDEINIPDAIFNNIPDTVTTTKS